MKVIILAGGYGTRLSEYTESIPKPMVSIGGRPILWHIMNSYAHYGHEDFYLALGYKSEVVKDYFLRYPLLNTDLTVDLRTGNYQTLHPNSTNWNVTLVDSGENTMTGGRVRRMKKYIGNETFMLTYGDGLSDIDLNLLQKFHKSHGKMVTISAVHPSARFGELKITGDMVSTFQEKPQTEQGWINGGFFIVEPEFFDLIDGDSTVLEREPLEHVASLGQLMAFKHQGFWQCMDTKRDRDFLESLWKNGSAPWRR